VDDSFRNYRSTKTFASLDGLRAASILAVVWHHTAGTSDWGTTSWGTLLRRGFLGVDMFFVLSGFLIVTLLLRERETHGDVDLGKFYIRRALRIFPVYYALLFVLAVILGFLRPGASWAPAFFAKLPYYLTYTSNWLPDVTLLAVTWSLATEEQFYFVWPPMEKWLAPRRLLTLLVGFIAVNQLVNFQVGYEFWPAWLREARSHLEILQITLTPICLGVVLAHALHRPAGFANVRCWAGSGVGQLAAIALLLFAATRAGDISGWPRLVVQLSLTWLLASCVVREDHVLRRITNFAPLARLGVVSYGMYLYHLLLLPAAAWGVRRWFGDSAAALFLACTVVTYLAAEASFRGYETPFLRLKERFAGRGPVRSARTQLELHPCNTPS
jgi:peptidoglycan/LPS O-acetylase OafA/YrhL